MNIQPFSQTGIMIIMVQNGIMEKRIMESWYKIHKVITAVTCRKKCYLVVSWQPLPQRLTTCQLDTDLDNQKNEKLVL